jgi:F420-0:gamma-glutamyl ligase
VSGGLDGGRCPPETLVDDWDSSAVKLSDVTRPQFSCSLCLIVTDESSMNGRILRHGDGSIGAIASHDLSVGKKVKRMAQKYWTLIEAYVRQYLESG